MDIRMDTQRTRLVLACSLLVGTSTTHADGGSLTAAQIPHPANAPAWFMPAYLHALRSPLPAGGGLGTTPPVIPQFQVFPDSVGLTGNYQPGGAVTTADNAFF